MKKQKKNDTSMWHEMQRNMELAQMNKRNQLSRKKKQTSCLGFTATCLINLILLVCITIGVLLAVGYIYVYFD